MKERFLPIGTVVQLKGIHKELMITCYCIFPTGDKMKSEREMFEYGGCPYPEGILDSNTVNAFNHDQIERVIFLGYESTRQKELSKILNQGYEIYKNKYESIE